ncbi:MAG: phosphoglucosamine mutase [Pyrinomonadaceae bacterium]|nr:phosphoglucosamine mutase [Phycisphaerales bacterium]
MSADAPLMLSVSGCRGIFGRTMTPETAARFAGVFGAFLRERATDLAIEGTKPLVVLARDGRAGGECLLIAASAGLMAAGCDVHTLGVAMTPTVGVMVDARKAAGGLVLTASHNPQEWNGLKPVLRSASLSAAPIDASAPGKDTADQLIALYEAASDPAFRARADGKHTWVGPTQTGAFSDAPRATMGIPSEPTNTHLYVVKEALKEIGAHDDRASMAITCVLDSVNASGVEAGAALLGKRLVHHLGAGGSGLFPHPPEPTKENLVTLGRFTAEKRADVGFAQDPDADRLAIIDERGGYIGEEYTLVLAAEAVLGAMEARSPGSTKGQILCVNLSTSRMIEDVAAKYGARVIRTAVGEANVVSAMKKHGSVLGGEGNGGVIWPRVTYIRDSLGSMGLVLALMARTGKKISQLVADVPEYAIVKRKVELRAKEDAQRAVEVVAQTYARERVDRQDGVRIDFDAKRAWLHVRASNTEPIMRLIAEAPTKAIAEAVLDDAARVIG